MDEFRINRLFSRTWFTVHSKLAAEYYWERWRSFEWSEIFSIIRSWFNIITTVSAANYCKRQRSDSYQQNCCIRAVYVKRFNGQMSFKLMGDFYAKWLLVDRPQQLLLRLYHQIVDQ